MDWLQQTSSVFFSLNLAEMARKMALVAGHCAVAAVGNVESIVVAVVVAASE